MKKTKNATDLHLTEQATAQIIAYRNIQRLQEMHQALDTQDASFKSAQDEIQKVRDFINQPEHILGRPDTKHGEVAEHLEIGVRRAYDALFQKPMSANLFDGEHRMAPEDYRADGSDIQSKYYNGARNTLHDGVLGHLNRYPWFGNKGQFYHVPRDQFAQMETAFRGNTPEGLSDATAETLRKHIRQVVEKMGRPFEEVIRPASYKYSEVQLREAPLTLDREHAHITDANDGLRHDIDVKHQPNLTDAAIGIGAAAAIAAGLNLGYGLYKKRKAGKSLFDLTKKDWKELGLVSAKASRTGAVSAAAIYGLTNFADMAAPLAGAIASTTRGIYTQIDLYRGGKLSDGQLTDNCMSISGEAGIIALCAVTGQGLIPIPVLGSIVGTIVGKFVSKILMDSLKESGKALAESIDNQTTVALGKLDAYQRKIVAQFTSEFDALDDLITNAFDPELNMRLVEMSVELAIYVGVSEEKILRNRNDLDSYITC